MSHEIVLLYLLCCLPVLNSAVSVLSCLYGASECLGLLPGDGLEQAQELGCPTSADGQNGGFTQLQFNQTLGPGSVSRGVNLAGSFVLPYSDGMPCTFSPYDEWSTLVTITLQDIQVTLTDGSEAIVSGATWLPAVEHNEERTLLLLGNFGYRNHLEPQTVTIKGSSYSGSGLHYNNTGEELVYAKWWTVEEHEALDGIPMRPGDSCQAEFPSSTHVIQVVSNGGITVTYDNNQHLPSLLENSQHKSMFEIQFGNGRILASEYLGMADIKDNDNFVDLCLRLAESDVLQIANEGASVRLFSTRACYFLVAPKGDCLNSLVRSPCGDSSTRSQAVCVAGIPDAQVDCALASSTHFEPTAEEMAALTCPSTIMTTTSGVVSGTTQNTAKCGKVKADVVARFRTKGWKPVSCTTAP